MMLRQLSVYSLSALVVFQPTFSYASDASMSSYVLDASTINATVDSVAKNAVATADEMTDAAIQASELAYYKALLADFNFAERVRGTNYENAYYTLALGPATISLLYGSVGVMRSGRLGDSEEARIAKANLRTQTTRSGYQYVEGGIPTAESVRSASFTVRYTDEFLSELRAGMIERYQFQISLITGRSTSRYHELPKLIREAELSLETKKLQELMTEKRRYDELLEICNRRLAEIKAGGKLLIDFRAAATTDHLRSADLSRAEITDRYMAFEATRTYAYDSATRKFAYIVDPSLSWEYQRKSAALAGMSPTANGYKEFSDEVAELKRKFLLARQSVIQKELLNLNLNRYYDTNIWDPKDLDTLPKYNEERLKRYISVLQEAKGASLDVLPAKSMRPSLVSIFNRKPKYSTEARPRNLFGFGVFNAAALGALAFAGYRLTEPIQMSPEEFNQAKHDLEMEIAKREKLK